MLDFEMSYSSKGTGGTSIEGPEKISFRTIQDMEKFIRLNFISVAKNFLKEEQTKGFPKKDFTKIVDNKLNKSELKVNVFGKIEYVTKIGDVREVIRDVMEVVIKMSPTVTGYYQSTNALFYNGKMVSKGMFETEGWLKVDRKFKDSDTFRIVNLAPYARKLERLGIRKGTKGKYLGQNHRKYRKGKNKKGQSIRNPNGAYWLAHKEAKKLYPGLKSFIRFSFIPINPSIASKGNSRSFSPNSYTFHKKGEDTGVPYLYPSITIKIDKDAFSSSSKNAAFTEGAGRL